MNGTHAIDEVRVLKLTLHDRLVGYLTTRCTTICPSTAGEYFAG